MKIIFFDADKEIKAETLKNMRKERMSGNLVFVCSRKPYYQTYLQYFRYANGFVCNDYNYVQMGCCEVMRDAHYTSKEIECLYQKVHSYAVMIMHGVKDSYVYKDQHLFLEYRFVPYCDQSVYSISLNLENSDSLKEVKTLLESEYELKQVSGLLFDLNQKSSSLLQSCKQVCAYFDVQDMEIR